MMSKENLAPMLENWIETHSGNRMYFLDPQPDMIDIDDIAHSLSLQCRFSGHTREFYSVAEHSVRAAQHMSHRHHPVHLVLQALLHDASEAYLLDVPSPVKQCLTNYKDIENKLMQVIMKKYGCSYPLDPLVKDVDGILLKNEARQLLPSKGASWVSEYPTSYESMEKVWCLNPQEAKRAFLDWFVYATESMKPVVEEPV